jgi:hypothetical protein
LVEYAQGHAQSHAQGLMNIYLFWTRGRHHLLWPTPCSRLTLCLRPTPCSRPCSRRGRYLRPRRSLGRPVPKFGRPSQCSSCVCLHYHSAALDAGAPRLEFSSITSSVQASALTAGVPTKTESGTVLYSAVFIRRFICVISALRDFMSCFSLLLIQNI